MPSTPSTSITLTHFPPGNEFHKYRPSIPLSTPCVTFNLIYPQEITFAIPTFLSLQETTNIFFTNIFPSRYQQCPPILDLYLRFNSTFYLALGLIHPKEITLVAAHTFTDVKTNPFFLPRVYLSRHVQFAAYITRGPTSEMPANDLAPLRNPLVRNTAGSRYAYSGEIKTTIQAIKIAPVRYTLIKLQFHFCQPLSRPLKEALTYECR